MSVEVTIPELGESITEAVITSWLKADGDTVAADEPLCELETDKASVELPSPTAGTLTIVKAAGETVHVGDTIAQIDEATAAAAAPRKRQRSAPAKAAAPPKAAEPVAAKSPEPPSPTPAPPAPEAPEAPAGSGAAVPLSPAARRLVEEHDLDPASIAGSGRDGRLTKADVLAHIEAGGGAQQPAAARSAHLSLVQPDEEREQQPAAETDAPERAVPERPAAAAAPASDDDEERVRMTPLRRTIAKRLVAAQQTAAILTTFNEIDMQAVMDLRKRHKESFAEKHGVSLGFMSFFASACVQACEEVPAVNAHIEGDEIVYSKRVHLGIAASTDRGLVVPVVRNADRMDLADLEREIGRLAGLARNNKLALDDLSGGTFTISNGGVFGSLMSTPILNPPQSGILGMHKIEKRPIVIDDEIAIRPMMYVALSYDHRLVDGREAVTFLVRVKERIEDPERMLLDI